MKRHRISDFTGGWIVGDFEPTILSTPAVEVALKHYQAGDREPEHHHRVATELTVIVTGRVRMSGREFEAGDVVEIPPGTSTDFIALTDTITTVVKMPSVAGDKYPGPCAS